jgi:UDP-N-acetyl-D-glucosamine dehydrogenase
MASQDRPGPTTETDERTKVTSPLTVLVVGQGYVGLPLTMRSVEAGYRVIGFDTDARRVKRLGAGDSYVEDVTPVELAGALATGRYQPTSHEPDCAEFDVALITVPTPLREGVPDLSFIVAAGKMLGAHLRHGNCVVLESTTYPGTTKELLAPILEERSGLVAGEGFHLGNKTWGLKNTPKVVSGVNASSLQAVQDFYGTLVERTVAVSGTGEAELAKLIENTFRHVNVALVNELAMFAGDLGVNIWEAIEAAATKPFGFMRFSPGPGVGGHCLPIDPSFLSWRVRRRAGSSFRFVELANDINENMPDYVLHRLMLALNRKSRAVRGCRVLLLGLAYKPNTSDARESPSLVLADHLLALGAEVRAADPHIKEGQLDARIQLVDLCEEEVAAADAVVLLTDHDAFDHALIVAQATYVLDTRGRLVGEQVEHL